MPAFVPAAGGMQKDSSSIGKSKSSPPFLPFKMGYLTDDMVVKARRELGETEEARRKGLEELRAYIKSEKNLVCPSDEQTLLPFLRVRKFDINRAIKLLNNYFTMKKNNKDVFGVDNYEALMKSVEKQFLNVLPYRDHDGCAIILLKFRNWDVSETSMAILLHHMACLFVSAAEDPATQVCGVKVIADTNGMTMRHVSAAHPKYLHLLAVGLRDALPTRVKAIHIINDSFPVRLLWKTISCALTDKINKRVRLHGSAEKGIAKYFDPRLLPKQYGGILEFDNSVLRKHAEESRDDYEEKLLLSGYR